MGMSSRIVRTAEAGPPRRWITAKIAAKGNASDIVVFIDFLAGANIFTWIKPHCPELFYIYFVLC